MNNNVADISLFESLQSGQHERMGINPMAVFNDLNKVKDLVAQYKSLVETYNKSHIPQAKAVYAEYQEAIKTQGVLQADNPVWQKVKDTFETDLKLKNKIMSITKQLKTESNKERNDILKDKTDKATARKNVFDAVVDDIDEIQKSLRDQAAKFDLWFDIKYK
ncbi:MAG: hypothetical protein LBP59_11025 [Planctomycetaceae bacterium]|jgi:hypothetical protein|nr:hypothetical protein [Planctomycetaceae bacterium]